MSILIKGMEMPKETDEVFCIDIFPDGRVEWHCAEKIKGVQVVPVPPHGRLIDADALVEDLLYDVELDSAALDSMNITGTERANIQLDKDIKQNCVFNIQDAPTFIEAEET